MIETKSSPSKTVTVRHPEIQAKYEPFDGFLIPGEADPLEVRKGAALEIKLPILQLLLYEKVAPPCTVGNFMALIPVGRSFLYEWAGAVTPRTGTI